MDTIDPDRTTGEPDPTTDGSEAILSISDGPTYEFGDVATGSELSHVFMVTNQGNRDATGLAGTVAAPFELPGGFPGVAGDCGAVLGAGESCSVHVVFAPAELGRHAGTLAVSHDGGEAMRALAGGAVGQTTNLLVNPGGEVPSSPPAGWDQAQGDWHAGVVQEEAAPVEGAGYLYANTGPNGTDYVLLQDVDLSGFAFTIDENALQVSFSGQGRGWLNGQDDQHRIRVHYLDEGGAPLQSWTTDYQGATEWQAYADSRVAPVGTRMVRVELNCHKDAGTWCNAYFDALALHASYP